jgi:uncharacterized protein
MSVDGYIGFAQSVFAVALVVVFPMIDLPAMQRLKQFSSGPARLALYRRSVVSTWAFTIVAVALASPRSLLIVPRHLGDFPWLDDHPVIHVLTVLLVALLFGWILWPSLRCAVSRSVRQAYFHAYRSSFIRFLLPVARQERIWWAWLSLTAGIGEELLYRGFMLQYFAGHLAGDITLPLTFAWLLSSLAFGVGHVYQGVRGVMETTVAGMTFGLLAILSGSLFLPMALHTLIDLRILLTYHPEQDAPDEAATLISGFSAQNR